MSLSDANAKHRWYTIDRRGRDRPTLAPLTPAPHSAGLFLGPLGTPITLRQGARVIEDSRRLRVV